MKRKPAAVLALMAAVALLPGCYFCSKAIPLDPSGMKYPAHHFADQTREQVRESGKLITGLPESFSSHCRTCWRNITENPADF